MTDKQIQPGWRIKLGFALFIASICWPVLLPVMPFLGFSGASIATFSGAMLVAAELMIIAGAAIAGKDGFAFIKQKIFGILKSYGPPQDVSRTRYIIGLIIFCIPVVLGWACAWGFATALMRLVYFTPVLGAHHAAQRALNGGGALVLLLALRAGFPCARWRWSFRTPPTKGLSRA